ncbi:hypothetical protein TNCV_401121 [Trichonephila clavipes]|nr:hypothetical protein TNCV_401121 [Trichonephila clavipes]
MAACHLSMIKCVACATTSSGTGLRLLAAWVNSNILTVLPLFLMPPVSRSQIETHEVHRGKGLEVRLSLVLALSTNM